MWRKSTAGRKHVVGGFAAAFQVLACLSMDFSWTPVYVHMLVTIPMCAKCDLRRTSLNVTNFQRVDYSWVAFGNGAYCGGLSRQVVQQAKSAEGGKFP